jgi:hypothetical protein
MMALKRLGLGPVHFACHYRAVGSKKISESSAAFGESCAVCRTALERGDAERLLVGPPIEPVFPRYS